MEQVSGLLRSQRTREQQNLDRLAGHVRSLDVVVEHPDSDPYPEALLATRQRELEARRTDDDAAAAERQRLADLRATLPHRSTHGGPYGSSILDRVAASYGRGRPQR